MDRRRGCTCLAMGPAKAVTRVITTDTGEVQGHTCTCLRDQSSLRGHYDPVDQNCRPVLRACSCVHRIPLEDRTRRLYPRNLGPSQTPSLKFKISITTRQSVGSNHQLQVVWSQETTGESSMK